MLSSKLNRKRKLKSLQRDLMKVKKLLFIFQKKFLKKSKMRMDVPLTSGEPGFYLTMTV